MVKEYEIGEKVREYRIKIGLSQSQVVESLSEQNIIMKRETLSKIENNSRSISAIELNALCNVFNVDIGDFFQKEEEDIVTFFRKRNFSESSLEEISKLQDMVKLFITQEKIYKK